MTCPAAHRRQAQARQGRPQAGQAARRPGSHLARSASPDGTVPHFPRGTCECGAALEAAADLGVAASHQEVDIPLETAKVIQHDLHEVACGCGRVHWAAAPAGTGAPGAVTYGLALQAWCVYLMAAHAIPVHRCAELIEALTGAEPSPGFVHSMISRAAAVADANRAIRCLIILAHVISADETPIRAGPGPKSPKKYPAGRVHQPAHPLLPRRPVAEDLRRVRPARHGRGRHRPRPVPELRAPPRPDPPALLPAPMA